MNPIDILMQPFRELSVQAAEWIRFAIITGALILGWWALAKAWKWTSKWGELWRIAMFLAGAYLSNRTFDIF